MCTFGCIPTYLYKTTTCHVFIGNRFCRISRESENATTNYITASAVIVHFFRKERLYKTGLHNLHLNTYISIRHQTTKFIHLKTYYC